MRQTNAPTENDVGTHSEDTPFAPAVDIDPAVRRRGGAIHATYEKQIASLQEEVSLLRTHLSREGQQRELILNALQQLHRKLIAGNSEEAPASPNTASIEEIIAAVTELARESEQVKGMLKTSVAWFRALTENALDITAILDGNFCFTYLTPSVNRVLGHEIDNLLGESLLPLVHPEDLSQARHWLTNLVAGLPVEVPFTLRVRNSVSELRILEVTGNNCMDLPAVGGIVINGRDITERTQAQERIRHLAHHDELTGLPNRNLVQDRALAAMGRADRDGTHVALLFLDLDRFKHVNDSLGHQVGDRLLQYMAARLESAVRQIDTVGRLGGDEFVLVLPDFKDARDVAPLAAKLLDLIGSSVQFDGHELHATASIGVSVYPDDGASLETLMRNADTAMYYAKAAGRNTFQFFTEQMNHAAQARLRMEIRLRRALRDEEFVLYYQPIVSAGTGAIVAAEALIRWMDPEHGMVPPSDFISVAEDLGLIEEIGAWVLQEACRQNQRWQHGGLLFVPISVNLSAEQFRTREIFNVVASALAETQLDPKWLDLEITESLLMEHTDQTISLLTELNRLGVQLSIDDFGTGYSSLSYLTRFPIQKLKIDKSFVRDLKVNRSSAAITSAVIAMGHSLRLKVLAEGVETEEQLEFMRSRGCDEVQGFYFSRPVSATDFECLVGNWKARSIVSQRDAAVQGTIIAV